MTNEEVHGDLYDKYNSLLEKVGECVGTMKSANEINLQFIALLKKVLLGSFIIIILLILSLIFGALGPNGFKAVTTTLPSVPLTADAIPAHNDFDKWHSRKV